MATSTMPVPAALEVAGAPLSAQRLELLTSLRVETAVNLVGRLTLRFADVGYQLSSGEVFGIDAVLRVTVPGAQQVLFHGTVKSIALDHSAGQVPELVVIAEEPTWRLARDTTIATYEKMSAADVLTRLLRSVGLTLVNRAPALSGHLPDYTAKIGSSLAHLDEAVRAHNAMWRFEAPNKVHVDPVSAVAPASVRLSFPRSDGTATPDQRLLTFSVKATAGTPRKTQVNGWDPKTKQTIEGIAQTEGGEPHHFAQLTARSVSGIGTQGLRTNAGTPQVQAEAQTLAKAIQTSMDSDALIGRGTALADPRIRPGVALEITDVGPSSGTYLVTRVEHVYDRRGFHTTFHTGSHRPRGLVDTLGGGGRPEARAEGIQVGIVTNINDPEKLGRVRVKLPSLLGNDVESAWARVSTFDAGNGRGATFLPEVDDEVLVGFEEGSLRRPVVLGSVYGGKNKQPELGRLLGNGQVNTRRLTSRSGHALEMVDEKGKEAVLLKHGRKEMSIKLDEASNSLTIEAQGGDLKLTNGQATVTLASNGDITIDGAAIKIKAKAGLSMEASGPTDLKTQATLNVEGASTTVKGKGAATFEGGMTTIKGGTVLIN
ncbi:phage baseplate assembly protein V [Nocardioides sp. LHD-245]|uniref:phage baseplate assembly protein V n=1 Tax=Nocardioides sp. LHD-245 TaxID=3051387 RepID=UPI0027E083E2|nr:phage baseplate assembly protein V [Nocardioides sp. LHD-245]